jgi:hypothetical protein
VKFLDVFRRLRARRAIQGSREGSGAGMPSPSREELERFLADREGRFQGLLVNDGVIYRTTPFEIIAWVLDEWRGYFGELTARRLLDFGTGDLRYALLASNLLRMQVVAVEFDSVVYLDAKESYREAKSQGYTSGLTLEPRMNVLHLSWSGFDIIHYFYTHPDTAGGSTQKRAAFRSGIQDKMRELEPEGALSLLFTDAQIRAGHHEFPDLMPLLERPPSFVAQDGVSYHLQLYRHRSLAGSRKERRES